MWTDITGQNKVKEKLISLYNSGKVSHAYLFYGAEGTGKDAASIEFAKVLNCTKNDSSKGGCNQCVNCKNINELREDYFKLICALPSPKTDISSSDPIDNLSSTDFELYLEEFKLKSENPYHHINIPNANNIRIDSVRDLAGKIFLSADKNITKVFLISEADKMRLEAANSLLKILEEPPKNCVIILTTSRLNMLPQTVIGRCQKIFFEPLEEKQIAEKILNENRDEEIFRNIELVRLAAKFSGGSYTKTVGLLNMDLTELREKVIKYLLSLLTDDFATLTSVIRDFSGKTNRERVKYFLYLLNVWFKDLMLLNSAKSKSDTEQIINSDLFERLSKFNSKYPATNIFQCLLSLEESEKLLLQNVMIDLILINLAVTLKQNIIR